MFACSVAEIYPLNLAIPIRMFGHRVYIESAMLWSMFPIPSLKRPSASPASCTPHISGTRCSVCYLLRVHIHITLYLTFARLDRFCTVTPHTDDPLFVRRFIVCIRDGWDAMSPGDSLAHRYSAQYVTTSITGLDTDRVSIHDHTRIHLFTPAEPASKKYNIVGAGVICCTCKLSCT